MFLNTLDYPWCLDRDSMIAMTLSCIVILDSQVPEPVEGPGPAYTELIADTEHTADMFPLALSSPRRRESPFAFIKK